MKTRTAAVVAASLLALAPTASCGASSEFSSAPDVVFCLDTGGHSHNSRDVSSPKHDTPITIHVIVDAPPVLKDRQTKLNDTVIKLDQPAENDRFRGSGYVKLLSWKTYPLLLLGAGNPELTGGVITLGPPTSISQTPSAAVPINC